MDEIHDALMGCRAKDVGRIIDIIDKLNDKVNMLYASKIVESAPSTSSNTARGEICSNSVCLYCQHFDGEQCNVPCGRALSVDGNPSSFIGRKLSPVA
jgi:hypothetical protein